MENTDLYFYSPLYLDGSRRDGRDRTNIVSQKHWRRHNQLSTGKMRILIELLITGFGIYQLWRSFHLKRKGQFTLGTLKKVMFMGRSAYGLIKFYPKKHKPIVIKIIGPRFTFDADGSSVPVLYDPDQPSNAIVDALDTLWLTPLLFMGIGFYGLYQEIFVNLSSF